MGSKFRCCSLFAGLVSLAVPAAAAEDALSGHLLRQLSCATTPSALPSLVAFVRGGRFDMAEGQRRDSTTCWSLKPSFDLEGMTFDHVCASSEDPLLVSLFPDFFFRGPGTSAGESLTLTTTQPLPALQSWAKAHFGAAADTVAQSEEVEGEAEIGCRASLALP